MKCLMLLLQDNFASSGFGEQGYNPHFLPPLMSFVCLQLNYKLKMLLVVLGFFLGILGKLYWRCVIVDLVDSKGVCSL